MKIDINRKTFALANKTGGVSGPIVKPVAVQPLGLAEHLYRRAFHHDAALAHDQHAVGLGGFLHIPAKSHGTTSLGKHIPHRLVIRLE